MKVIISGASGFVGTALTTALRARADTVIHLVRRPPEDPATEVQWRPADGVLDPDVVSGADVVINLNGRNISSGRWNDDVKAELRSSRLDSTGTLVSAIGRSDRPPRLLISASATGFYGDRGDDVLDENAARGDGFLAELAADWEAAAERARSDATRVALIRLGMVLGDDGGALDRMLLPFKLGLGGPIGNGRQRWPWIAMDDVVGAIQHVSDRDDIDGPVNLVAPEPVTSRDFARTLGDHLGRPAFLPAPTFAVKAALGEMAEALLLASTNVTPAVLEETGYRFKAPTLAEAFRLILD
jgi:uncharacterized protein (TIGR01777 family)